MLSTLAVLAAAKSIPDSTPQTLDVSKLNMSQYYPTLGKSLPLDPNEFATIEKENPDLIQMMKDGTAPPIPVRDAGNGMYEPSGDGANRTIIANNLGIDPKVTFEEGANPPTKTGTLSNPYQGIARGETSPSTPEDITNSAIKDATPSYNKNLIGESGIRNPDGTITPRINEAEGLLGKRTVNSTPSEIAAGTELSKLNGYPTNGTSLEKAQFTDNSIASKGKALDASLAKENILRPPQELNKVIKTAVMDTADKSQLLSKSDPIVKNYLRSSQRIVNASDGTLAGERQVVLKLDQAYEDAGGKYANNKPLDQIHRAARQSLIDDMESKAQNTEVKGALKEMQNLYHANDVLWDKAKSEGGSVLEQLQKAHPLITHFVKSGLNAVKLGGVIKGAESI